MTQESNKIYRTKKGKEEKHWKKIRKKEKGRKKFEKKDRQIKAQNATENPLMKQQKTS